MAKTLFLLFLVTILSSSQILAVRDPQLFNKIPSNNAARETQEVAVPKTQEPLNNKPEQQPEFIPENENGGYGLYGHETGQFPPSTTTTTAPATTNPGGEQYKTTTTNLPYNNQPRDSYPKYLPKNYNTEAYVTEPEGYKPSNNYNNNNNNNNFYNGENTYYNNNQQQQDLGDNTYYNNEEQSFGDNTYYNHNNGQQQGFGGTKLMGSSFNTNPTHSLNNNNNFGVSNGFYTGEQQGMSDTRSNNNYYSSNGGVQKQGMSDTRFLENGKYFYDTSMEQTLNRGPYGANSNRGYYWNVDNNNNRNSYNNYQDQEQDQFQNFQDDEEILP